MASGRHFTPFLSRVSTSRLVSWQIWSGNSLSDSSQWGENTRTEMPKNKITWRGCCLATKPSTLETLRSYPGVTSARCRLDSKPLVVESVEVGVEGSMEKPDRQVTQILTQKTMHRNEPPRGKLLSSPVLQCRREEIVQQRDLHMVLFWDGRKEFEEGCLPGRAPANHKIIENPSDYTRQLGCIPSVVWAVQDLLGGLSGDYFADPTSTN